MIFGVEAILSTRFVFFVFCFVFFVAPQVSLVGTLVKSASRQQAAAYKFNRLLARAELLGHLLAQGTPFKAKLIGAVLAPP